MLHAHQKRVSGVTLFEVLLVLFVAAFIAAAVATIYAKVSLTFKQNQLQSGLQQLAANISAAYNGQYPSSNVAASTLINAGMVPQDMYSATTPVTPFNTGNTAWVVVGATSTFTITVDNIPAGACSGMLQPLMQISNGAALMVDGGDVSDATTGLTACSSGGSSGLHTMTITVR